jgi:hypothetical protein
VHEQHLQCMREAVRGWWWMEGKTHTCTMDRHNKLGRQTLHKLRLCGTKA